MWLYIFHSDSVNSHLEINFDLLASTVRCSFTSRQTSGEKHCIIEYGPEDSTMSCTLPLLYKSESRRNTSNSLTIDLHASGLSQSTQSNRYCYIITARNGATVVKVEGLFNAGACLSTLHLMCIMIRRFYAEYKFFFPNQYSNHTMYKVLYMCASCRCTCMCVYYCIAYYTAII